MNSPIYNSILSYFILKEASISILETLKAWGIVSQPYEPGSDFDNIGHSGHFVILFVREPGLVDLWFEDFLDSLAKASWMKKKVEEVS